MLKNDALYADKARQVSELAVDLVELLREEPLEKLAIRGSRGNTEGASVNRNYWA